MTSSSIRNVPHIARPSWRCHICRNGSRPPRPSPTNWKSSTWSSECACVVADHRLVGRHTPNIVGWAKARKSPFEAGTGVTRLCPPGTAERHNPLRRRVGNGEGAVAHPTGEHNDCRPLPDAGPLGRLHGAGGGRTRGRMRAVCARPRGFGHAGCHTGDGAFTAAHRAAGDPRRLVGGKTTHRRRPLPRSLLG